jgi:hypothetical protein
LEAGLGAGLEPGLEPDLALAGEAAAMGRSAALWTALLEGAGAFKGGLLCGRLARDRASSAVCCPRCRARGSQPDDAETFAHAWPASLCLIVHCSPVRLGQACIASPER